MVGMAHVEELAEIQKQIRTTQAEEAELLQRRSRVILAAREAGLTNREIAHALDVHESHVYRMIKK